MLCAGIEGTTTAIHDNDPLRPPQYDYGHTRYMTPPPPLLFPFFLLSSYPPFSLIILTSVCCVSPFLFRSALPCLALIYTRYLVYLYLARQGCISSVPYFPLICCTILFSCDYYCRIRFYGCCCCYCFSLQDDSNVFADVVRG